MEEDNLATELLREVKATSKRWFILFIITLFLLFITNVLWLYAYSLPTEETTSTSYDIQSEDDGNAVYSESGGVTIGESDSNQTKNN